MLQLPHSGQCHYTVTFSPCGRWLVAGGSEYAADVWDLHNPAVRLDDLGGPIVRAAFTPDGRLIVRGTADARVYDARLWGQKPAKSRTHWVADDRHADLAGYVGLRDQTPDIAAFLNVTPRPHRAVQSPDGRLAATLANGNLSVWDLTALAPVVDRTSPKHGGWLALAFDPHGRRIATGGIDSTVAVWDAASAGPPLTVLQWGMGPVYAVTFDREGLRAAAAGHSGAIVWDADE